MPSLPDQRQHQVLVLLGDGNRSTIEGSARQRGRLQQAAHPTREAKLVDYKGAAAGQHLQQGEERGASSRVPGVHKTGRGGCLCWQPEARRTEAWQHQSSRSSTQTKHRPLCARQCGAPCLHQASPRAPAPRWRPERRAALLRGGPCSPPLGIGRGFRPGSCRSCLPGRGPSSRSPGQRTAGTQGGAWVLAKKKSTRPGWAPSSRPHALFAQQQRVAEGLDIQVLKPAVRQKTFCWACWQLAVPAQETMRPARKNQSDQQQYTHSSSLVDLWVLH